MSRILAPLGLLCLTAFAFAQFDIVSMSRMQSKPVLALSRVDIKKELKLTKEQDQAIVKIVKEFQGSIGGRRGNNEADIAAAMSAPARMDTASDEIVALLDEGQKKRLFEIRIQIQGPPALGDTEVVKALGMSDDQIAKVSANQATYSKEVLDLMQSGSKKSLVDRMSKQRDANDQRLLAILTDDQKAKFKELQGKEFKNARMKGF